MRNLLAMGCVIGAFATIGATAVLVWQGSVALGGWLVAGAVVLFFVGALCADGTDDDSDDLTEWEDSE